MEPLFLRPYYKKTVWAGTRLSKIRGLDKSDKLGISREICAYKDEGNIIESGEFKGQSITDLIKSHQVELMGNDNSGQLIRVAYMDTDKALSIQVHPGDEYAKAVENDYEKSEAWYILDCAEDAYITAGTTITDKGRLKEAALNGSIEQYTRKIPVNKGDFVLIPAGLLHACCEDVFAVEIGSFGGITYRVYDYGRGRELDIEKSFDVIDTEIQCTLSSFPKAELGKGYKKLEAIRHQLFKSNVIDIKHEYKTEKSGNYVVITVVEGVAELVVEEKRCIIPYTRSVLIPACIRNFEIVGECRVIESYR